MNFMSFVFHLELFFYNFLITFFVQYFQSTSIKVHVRSTKTRRGIREGTGYTIVTSKAHGSDPVGWKGRFRAEMRTMRTIKDHEVLFKRESAENKKSPRLLIPLSLHGD